MLRVCFYGGSGRDGTPMDFVSALAEAIVSTLPAVIVTGGYVGHDEGTTESAALVGVRRAAKALSTNVSSLFEVWQPDPRSDAKAAQRMNRNQGVTIRELPGRTSLRRRLSMVSGVDVVVTFTGRANTELVLEQAIELGVPVLPIAATGGVSRAVYRALCSAVGGPFPDDLRTYADGATVPDVCS